MDSTTKHYLDECLRPGSPLRTAVADAVLPPNLAAQSGHRLLARPLFVDEAELRDFAHDVDGLFDLVVSLPERLFGGDPVALAAALGVDERQAALLTLLGGGAPPRYGRADMYHDGTSFRLLELNVASQVGGVDRAGRLPAALLQVPAFAAFAAGRELGWTDTGRTVAETLRAAGAQVSGSREPVVVLVEEPGGLARYRRSWEPLQELMRGYGLDFHLGEAQELSDRGGRLRCGDRTVDVVMRAFGIEEVYADPQIEAAVRLVARAHQDGRAVLWTPLESHLYGDKGCLALLTDPARQAEFSPAERELIERILPPTRLLDQETLVEARAHRDRYVLKPSRGYGGRGVVAGWESTPDAWERALTDARSTGAVLQQRVTPRPEPVVDESTGSLRDWHASWGLFLTPLGPAGTYARALPAGDSAVIGITSNTATRTAAVFTVPSPPRGPAPARGR